MFDLFQPNENKLPMEFDTELVKHQVRYLGYLTQNCLKCVLVRAYILIFMYVFVLSVKVLVKTFKTCVVFVYEIAIQWAELSKANKQLTFLWNSETGCGGLEMIKI